MTSSLVRVPARSRAQADLAEVQVALVRLTTVPETLGIVAMAGVLVSGVAGLFGVALRGRRTKLPLELIPPFGLLGSMADPIQRDARYRACFSQSSDGMMLVRVEPDGSFIYEDMNEAWQRLCGQPAARSLGRQPHEVWAAPLADTILDRFRRCVSSGRPLHYEKIGIEGSGRNLRIVMDPVRATSGAARGRTVMLICRARDVTEQAQLDDRLQHERRMQTIRRLSAGVAHDFNNILQAVCGALELILDEAETPSIHDMAGIALGSAQRGSKLTHHLLSYARRQVLTPTAIDLRKLLAELRGSLAEAAGELTRVEFALGGDGIVFADETYLRMALLNLAANAAHAMPEGGVLRIACDTEASSAEFGASTRIVVSDTGIGMDAYTLARCAEPFFTTKIAMASGLGLSMVQGFAIQSGGALRVFSRPDEGTTVALILPAASIDTQPAVLPSPRAGRVLLVDDTNDVLLTTARLLERSGLEVMRAASGQAALALLSQTPAFDILITDYAMPGLSGIELIRMAREMQNALPALIITGLYDVDVGELQDAAVVLRKPFARQELLTAVHDLMRRPAPTPPPLPRLAGAARADTPA